MAGVNRVWAGWDLLREAKKLEARKMLENRIEPTCLLHALSAFVISEQKTSLNRTLFSF